MQYALVNSIKSLPVKGIKGICPGCQSSVVAKCGKIRVHHWAHLNVPDCDVWTEPETEWHRSWKEQFPIEQREISFVDENTNELHRADVHTSDGITLEFQNSPLSLDEMKSRETFYNKLIWVVNGLKFKDKIEATYNIPDPQSDILKNWDFAVNQNGFSKHLLLIKKADLMSDDNMVRYFGINDVELIEAKKLLSRSVALYRAIYWKNKRVTWLEATSPVFLDFGHEYLYWLRSREQILNKMFYIMAVNKVDFIKKYSG